MPRTRSAPLLLLLAAALLGGCAGHRKQVKEPDLRPLVGRVQIDGTDELKPTQIRPKLGQRDTHPLHWVPVFNFFYPAVRLDGTVWREDDRTRISNIYALDGFFDARVLSSQVVIKATRKDGSPRRVRVIHQVEEGPPSFIDDGGVLLMLDGPPEVLALHDELAEGLPVKPGERFSMEQVEQAERLLRTRLAERAYARAEVTSRVDAYPEDQLVKVRFDVRPGRKAVFGEVRITGLQDVRERYVLRHVRLKEGEPWDGRAVGRTQQEIYDMGVFALVTVTPELGDDVVLREDGIEVVPVDIFLKERKPRTIEGGGGVGFDLGGFDVHGRVSLTHVNAFTRLVRFETNLYGGFVFMGVDDFGPAIDLDASLRWPDFPFRTLSLHVIGGLKMDVERGYKYAQPEGEAGVTWAPLRAFKLSVSYSVSYFRLYDSRLDDLELAGLGDEIAFDDGYFLTVLRQEAIVDLRDNLLAPNKGLFASIAFDEALPPGTYRYVRFDGDVRGYIPLGTPRLVLALRGTGSYIATIGEDGQVPIDEAVFAGGDGSVRGWKSRYLGPRTLEEDCTKRDCIVPIGGRVGFTGALELRGNIWNGLWVAGFTDFGRVWSAPEDIAGVEGFFGDLQFSVGGGIRYDLSIGRLRLDFAIHPKPWTAAIFREEVIKPRFCPSLGQCPEDLRREPNNWQIHFGIGESF